MKNNRWLVLLNMGYILALLIVIIPLLICGNYNYPTADDWSFGIAVYQTRKAGGGIFEIAKAIWNTVQDNYVNWEGRFSSTFFACLQPGAWGEQYYRLTVWIMIGSIVISEILFARYFIMNKKQENKWLYLPVVLPALMLQILYVPYPDETFYWYTGAVNYTFVFTLSLLLIILFAALSKKQESMCKRVLMSVCATVLAVLVGGNNFATSLSTLLAVCCLSVVFFLRDRSSLKRNWFVTLALTVAFLLSVMAPANQVRINSNFDGSTRGPVWAVINSLVRSGLNIISWTDLKVLFLLVLIVPFLWKAVKNSEEGFRVPGLFTVISFGIYASQCTATMYVDGTTGGGRMGDILYYTYYIWLVMNVWYWLGWGRKRFEERLARFAVKNIRVYGIAVWVLAVIGLCGIGLVDKKELTAYMAYRNLRQGLAQQYAKEWEARLVILHDEAVEEVEVLPLSVRPDMLYYTDLQYKDGYYWVNSSCATYYGKKSVDLIMPE